jgi:hypothetical protein
VSHHGSANGIPIKKTLDIILPEKKQDNRPRSIVVPTFYKPFDSIPDQTLIKKELAPRCDTLKYISLKEKNNKEIKSSVVKDGKNGKEIKIEKGGFYDFEFKGN